MTVNNLIAASMKLWQMPWQQKLSWFIAVSLGLAWIFQLLTPTQVPIQPTVMQHYGNMNVTVKNIDFSGQTPTIPEKMPVATLTNYTKTDQEFVDFLIAKYALKPHATVADLWVGNTMQMTRLAEPEMISLFKTTDVNLAAQPETAETRTFNQALLTSVTQQAKDMVSELYKDKAPQLLENEIYYTSGAVEPEKVRSLDEAQLVYIPFAYTIGNYKVYAQQDNRYAAKFIYNVEGTLVKAEFFPYTLDVDLGRSYQSLTIRQAMSNLNNNQAALIFTDHIDPADMSLGKITGGTMTQSQVEYRFDPASGTVRPYYHFYGTLENTEGIKIRTEFLTPAIQTNFESDK